VTVGTATTVQATISNIEAIKGTFSAAGTISMLGTSGATSLTSSGSTAAATFTNIGSTSVNLGVSNTDQSATFGYTTAAVAGTADTATVTLSNMTAGTLTINGVETLNIASTSSANAVTAMVTNAATKYVVTGDQTLNLGTLPATVLTVDASAATAGVTFTSNQTTASTITGGSGNDALTFTGGSIVNDSINAGAGNDTVTVSNNLATTDTINGGDGTDVLSLPTTVATGYTKPTTATITNFETLKISNALAANLTLANVQSGLSTIDLAAGSGTFTVTGEAGALAMKIGAANTGDLTVSDTGTATTDSLTVTNSGSGISMFGAAAGALAVTGYETVTVNGSGTGTATIQNPTTITVTADSGGTSTLNLTGSNAFVSTGAITANVIDASGLTGTAYLTMGAAAADGTLTSLTGSSGNDTLRGDNSSSINGGSGNDTIVGGASNDTLLGGDGNDSITSGAGNDSINAGAGNDTVVLAGNLATGDVIDGGDGTDVLSITNASLSAVNAYSISAATALNNNISNIERVTLTDALDINAAFDVARIDSLSYITLTAGTTGAEELSGLANASTIVVGDNATLTATLADSTGSADSINFSLVDLDGTPSAETVAGLTTSGIETVNISVNESTASATVYLTTLTSLTATGASSVVISGTESLTVTNATSLKNVDASGLSAGTLSLSVANAASAATVIGGAGADTITGSANGDTITGGAGADSLDGAAGNDTLDGGAGADSLIGGTGNDSLTGGEGADSIIAGAGNDTIVLTETTATSDYIYFGRSDVAGTDLAVASQGLETVSGFTAGASGDVLSFDKGGVVVTNTTAKIATLSSDGATLTSLANTASATDVDIVIVLGDYGSYAAVQATLNASAAVITDATDGAVVIWRDGNGDTNVYFDSNISAGAGTGTALAKLTGVATASLVAANFEVLA